MSRYKIKDKRQIVPDYKFGSVLLSKFINILMLNGKKSIAQTIVYSALDCLSNTSGYEHLVAFNRAIHNVKPFVEIKSRRVGGSTYQVPIEINDNRSYTLAMRWIVHFSRKRKEHSMSLRLFNELLDSLFLRGLSVKKRNDVHKMAESNKAFSHYRW